MSPSSPPVMTESTDAVGVVLELVGGVARGERIRGRLDGASWPIAVACSSSVEIVVLEEARARAAHRVRDRDPARRQLAVIAAEVGAARALVDVDGRAFGDDEQVDHARIRRAPRGARPRRVGGELEAERGVGVHRRGRRRHDDREGKHGEGAHAVLRGRVAPVARARELGQEGLDVRGLAVAGVDDGLHLRAREHGAAQRPGLGQRRVRRGRERRIDLRRADLRARRVVGSRRVDRGGLHRSCRRCRRPPSTRTQKLDRQVRPALHVSFG